MTAPCPPAASASEASLPLDSCSQAIGSGERLFASDQLALGRSGAGDIGMQTLAMLDMMAAIRRKAGSHSDHVFTTTISPAGLVGFSGMNASYAAAIKPPSSARSIMDVSRRPGGIPLEIEGIAPAERKTP